MKMKMKIGKVGRYGRRCTWFESHEEYIIGFFIGCIVVLTVMNL